MRAAGVLVGLLAAGMWSPVPALGQVTTRSAQGDCQREASRNG